MATPTEPTDRSRNVSGQQVAIAVGVLVALLAAAWFFLLRDSGGTSAAPAPKAASSESAQKGKADKGGKQAASRKDTKKKKDRAPVESFEVFAPKDPFKPLVTASTGGSPTGESSGTSESTSTGSGTSGSTSSASETGGHTVSLVQIFTEGGEQKAQVRVDGTSYTVSEGETFAGSFQLVSIEETCASVLFGDDQFTLCEGEEILK
jgi:hypothetical protein